MLHRIALAEGADLDGFRHAVRRLVADNAPPHEVLWSSGAAPELFGVTQHSPAPPLSLQRDVAEIVERAICHRDPERYALLYDLIWRVVHGEARLLEVASDPLVHTLARMQKSVRRDIHKMHAFLRFRRVEQNGMERFVAWFEPDHFILEATANFFVDRFRALVWSIVTPIGSLHWDRTTLTFGPSGVRSDVPAGDDFDSGWRSYYENTFNPARTNRTAMLREMPKKYWRNMPETQAIPGLIQTAASRVNDMIERHATAPIKRNPEKAVAAMSDQNPDSLAELNRIIAKSEPLVPGATRAVLGEGPENAEIVFVGEQPGDQEDVQGRPFVGPAGQLLRRAIEDVGIDNDEVYFTNAVKHFKFEQRGKRRIHQSPTTGEIKHYRWWLVKELELIGPKLVVALGASAARALTGKAVSVTKVRGEASFDDRRGYITVHPSYLLRLPDEAAKQQGYKDFIADLRRIRDLAA